MDCSSSSPIHRIARRVLLHWIAFSFSPLAFTWSAAGNRCPRLQG
ncbi:hypothetical protein BAE44_0021347 [Dichanthelium oligosanthes]|uniref:Uncharacterized protein n=1 Tax=Dichanthelium oligosanthes TaxID=888268 RepID=A0A1E5UXH5_9POAL|nr:hypothetical protein BAE44_0021347 [Dichanthelium oligosanthes]